MSSFDQDMRDMRKQVSAEVAFFINSTPKLYNNVKELSAEQLKEYAYAYSKEHDNEFGTVFEAELDALNGRDWKHIRESI